MKGTDRGFIRYIGPVATSKKQTTQWLGIEFEKKGRGTNDGSVKTKDGEVHRYFTCEMEHGAFIRPSKARNNCSMCEVWADRYDDEAIAENQMSQLKLAEETDYKFTFVGFNHIEKARSKNATIRQLNVFMEPVTYVDDRKTIAAMFPKVQEIIYARTLMQSWETVNNLDALSNLVELDFGFNFMKYSTFDPEAYRDCFKNLRKLKLEGMESNWSVAVKMARVGCFPGLRTLCVRWGNLPTLDVDGETLTAEELATLFPKLKTLELGNNCLEDFKYINCFRLLPELTELQCFRNPIKGMFFTDGFEKLEMFMASYTNVSTWEEVRTVTKLTNLHHLGLSETDFVNSVGSWQSSGSILLTLLPNLMYLNQTEKRSYNQLDCGKVYWGFVCGMLDKRFDGKIPWQSLDLDQMEEDYPHFKKLKEKFGIVEKAKKKKKGMSLVDVTLISHDVQTCTMPSKTLKLPTKTKIATLKLLFKKQFKVPPAEQQLLIVESKKTLPEVMDQDQQTLAFYTMADKVEIRMVRKEV